MIDWSRVEELRTEIGVDDFDEVVELFLDEVHCVVERLRGTFEPDTLESDLHFLKGSALNLGFSSFSELCHAGERRAANGHRDSIDLPEILACFDQSKQVFTNELPNKFAA
ncbi:Hpt domain-containing protein [Thalassovita taeanensis]|uniref:HPt (Histidine-containing phosphotransfer) domain-containing protein n=1 Tax=Thalassovita taeanensis TaxID=657014 RepID=A0A1H9JL12_9RHOB|nr:Hpt domain-containing protein [Thalassovita taeanensis]SEQ87489.1 HPt (histidine-containing phosphotransfer) domain-containing protein [Thalassovita taeanensis]